MGKMENGFLCDGKREKEKKEEVKMGKWQEILKGYQETLMVALE